MRVIVFLAALTIAAPAIADDLNDSYDEFLSDYRQYQTEREAESQRLQMDYRLRQLEEQQLLEQQQQERSYDWRPAPDPCYSLLCD